jgi:hypothetical protein
MKNKIYNILNNMWLWLFFLAANKMGYGFFVPYEKGPWVTVIHVADTEASLLESMRLYIEEYEAEASSRKKEALAI